MPWRCFRSSARRVWSEAWGDDVPDGKATDFKCAVEAQPDEVVVFSWLEYPSREVRDAAVAKMRSDPRMQTMGETMPFDGKRMIYGGFAGLADTGAAGASPGYIDGTVIPVPTGSKTAYLEMASRMAPIFKEYGATRVVDGWGDDVPAGKLTDFRRAVKATADETVAFGWIEWPSKAARDAAWGKVMADPRMAPDHLKMPFDGKRMIHGGFAPIVDTQ